MSENSEKNLDPREAVEAIASKNITQDFPRLEKVSKLPRYLSIALKDTGTEIVSINSEAPEFSKKQNEQRFRQLVECMLGYANLKAGKEDVKQLSGYFQSVLAGCNARITGLQEDDLQQLGQTAPNENEEAHTIGYLSLL